MKKKKRRRTNQAVTVIVIPENAKKTLKVGLARRTLWGTGAAAAIMILIFIGVCTSYYLKRHEISHVNDLKSDNQQKLETINQLGQELNQIKADQGEIARKQEEIKKLMGVKTDAAPKSNSKTGGQGGEDLDIGPDPTEEDSLLLAQTMTSDLAREAKELDDYLARVNNNAEYFRSVPNTWPTRGQITSDFGWRRSPFESKKTTFHDGIDIANSYGTAIVAAGDGKVTFAGWQAAYGNMILIDHGSGFVTRYGHNSSMLVKVGDTVKKGQVISRMGSTGRSTGSHVHFSIFKGGVCQDPLVYLP
ncbi:MAG TPA: M23 family metallopeptidase [Syntrophomonadaceae bacterium]|nr:M23 family metallopeptidase [Syntrophomonadaceae bacterium]